MDKLWQDLRYAARTVVKSPGFTLVAVLMLALGIGANTAIFSLVNSILLWPLPFPEPNRLVRVFDVQQDAGLTPADYAEFLDWRAQSQIFDQMAGYFSQVGTLSGRGVPEQLSVARISANLFPMLGIEAVKGRGFRPEEELRSAERVCMISEGLWIRQFGSDPGIVGKKVTLSENPYTVVGVVRSTFNFPVNPEVFQPLRLDANVAPRGLHFISVVARLRAGLLIPQAEREIHDVSERLRKERSIQHGVQIAQLKEDTVGGTETPLKVMLGAVGFVLLIACANLASLFLSRGQLRRREVAIRMALGAGRAAILRLLLAESFLLAGAGGFLGLLVARWGMDALLAAGMSQIPRANEIRMDGTVFTFTAVLSILTALLFGLSPALETLRSATSDSLKEGARGSAGGMGRQRSVLVIAQVALSLVLLAGAGLFLRSFGQLLHVNKGFHPEQVLSFTLALSSHRYDQPAQQAAAYRQVLERLRSMPGVTSAGLVNNLALTGDDTNGGVTIEGRVYVPGTSTHTGKRIVSADYFRTMAIPLLRGRFFSEHDVSGATSVAIVNQAFARRYFSGEEPVGKRVAFLWGTEGFQEIVGVVGDIRHGSLTQGPEPELYVPFEQRPDSSFNVVVRSQANPAALVAAVRKLVFQIDSNLAVANAATLEEIVLRSVSGERFRTVLLGAFAAIALILTAVGLYGVVAYSVSQRTQEIGIRMALGAQPRDISDMVLRQGFRLVAIGTAIGILAALILARFVASLLFEVRPYDPLTFVAITILLAGVTLAAGYLPARRATRVDPLVALRYE